MTPRLRGRLTYVALLAALALAGLGTSAWLPLGQGQAWSQPVALSSDLQSAWFPDIAADATGRVHLVWSTGLSTGVNQTYDVVMYDTSPDGTHWAAPADLVALPSKGAVTRPTLLADDQAFLHITFKVYTVFYSRAPAQAVNAANLLPARLLSQPDNGYFSRLGLDSRGRLHAIYSENIQDPSCPECYRIFHRVSTDRGLTWSPSVDVSRVPTGAAKPQLVIDPQDRLHVVWEAGVGGGLGQLDQTHPTQVMYASSSDGGQSWTEPVVFNAPHLLATPTPTAAAKRAGLAATVAAATAAASATNVAATSAAATQAGPVATLGSPVLYGSKNITLGQDQGGRLVVAWLSVPEDQVYFATSADHGQTWSVPAPIPGVWGGWSVYDGRTDDYAMATDSAGTVHLALVGRVAQKQDTLSVLHLAWDGSRWSAPDIVTTLRGAAPEWPRLAIGLGNQLHLTWFVRDAAHIFVGEGSQYRIWYAQRLVAAPSLTPAVWPAVTAVPTVASTASPAPTQAVILAPVPTPGAFVAPANPNLVYNELDYMKLLGLSLIPAGLGLALIVALVRWLHR